MIFRIYLIALSFSMRQGINFGLGFGRGKLTTFWEKPYPTSFVGHLSLGKGKGISILPLDFSTQILAFFRNVRCQLCVELERG